MSKNIIAINANSTISAAIKILKTANITAAPVLDNEGHLVGVISESDILKLMQYNYLPIFEDVNRLGHIYKLASITKVSEIMSKYPITVHPDNDVYHVATMMWMRNIERLIVVDEKNKVSGMITRTDILKVL